MDCADIAEKLLSWQLTTITQSLTHSLTQWANTVKNALQKAGLLLTNQILSSSHLKLNFSHDDIAEKMAFNQEH
jgi:hypothetical protein